MEIKIDFNKVSNIEFDGVNHKDYPDYCDAYISNCEYENRDATDDEISIINENKDFVYEKLMEHLF